MRSKTKVFYGDWREASTVTIQLGITFSEARRRKTSISALYELLHTQDPRLPIAPWKFYTRELWSSINRFEGFTNPEKRHVVYDTIEEVERVVQAAKICNRRGYEQYRLRHDLKLPKVIDSYYGRKDWWEKEYGGWRQLFFGDLEQVEKRCD